MGIHIAVNERGEQFEGLAQGHITLTVQSPPGPEESEPRNSTVSFSIRVKIIPRPARSKRILWDQFHSLRYPPGYLPRDNLKIKSDPLDWRADHVHTNFKDMYTHLRNSGYYVDVLGRPFTCFNASHYGTLLMVDPEEEYFGEEIKKLKKDVLEHGLSVVVFADWYNTTVMKKIKFYDENTRQWWLPDTGGANIPALNELLSEFNILLSDRVAEGYFSMGDHGMYYASGTTLLKFPKGNNSVVVERDLHDQGLEILSTGGSVDLDLVKRKRPVPILGLLQTNQHFVSMEPLAHSGVQNGDDNMLQSNEHADHVDDTKNPIINKRILLTELVSNEIEETAGDELNNNNSLLADNNENSEEDLLKQMQDQRLANQNASNDKILMIEVPQNIFHINHGKPPPPTVKDNKFGRIVVYGDSNCLDSTGLEKPCFWLLDSILEYTMTSHLSNLLKSLNRTSDGRPPTPHDDLKPPVRLANNNLHLYSKVLEAQQPALRKRSLPTCPHLKWEVPIFLNMTAPHSLQQQQQQQAFGVVAEEQNVNMLRKLESQKGEVCRNLCCGSEVLFSVLLAIFL
jgi:hypothetical protein